MFPHCDIHKYTRTSCDDKMHNCIYHVSICRWNSSIADDQSPRRADFDTYQYLTVAEAKKRERGVCAYVHAHVCVSK
jgi:hypothetical protein